MNVKTSGGTITESASPVYHPMTDDRMRHEEGKVVYNCIRTNIVAIIRPTNHTQVDEKAELPYSWAKIVTGDL